MQPVCSGSQMTYRCGIDAFEADDSLGGGARPANCKSWECPVCSIRRRALLVAEVMAGSPNSFITITCREGEFGTPEAASEQLAKFWNTIVRRWRRLKKTNHCEFFVVREAHENGWPHLHIAWIGGWIDFEWLKAQATELLNSPHVYIQAVRGIRQVARYLFKYLGKAPTKFGSSKRYWRSRGWPKLDHEGFKPVFRSTLRFRHAGRTMNAIRSYLQKTGGRYDELPGGALGWGQYYDRPRLEPVKPTPRLRLRGGFWKYVSKAGVTPIERPPVA